MPIRLGATALAALGVVASAAVLAGASSARAHWRLPAHPRWYWQLQGNINNSEPAAIYDLDGFETSSNEVAKLHGLGKHVVCYIDVGTWENFRPDKGKFPKSVLGRPNGWPGERWLDVRRLPVLEPIMTARFKMCARKHFDAVEPDNMDGFENDTGFDITAREQLRYDEWIANEVHSLGMAVLEKNDPEQARTLEPYFDGVLDEQCNQYQECGSFNSYLRAGKPVLNAEYRSSLYPGFCSADERLGIMGVLYNLALDGRVYRPCWTAP